MYAKLDLDREMVFQIRDAVISKHNLKSHDGDNIVRIIFRLAEIGIRDRETLMHRMLADLA